MIIGAVVALVAGLVDLVAVCSGAGAQAVSTTAPLMHGSYPACVELLQAVSELLALLRVLRWVTEADGGLFPVIANMLKVSTVPKICHASAHLCDYQRRSPPSKGQRKRHRVLRGGVRNTKARARLARSKCSATTATSLVENFPSVFPIGRRSSIGRLRMIRPSWPQLLAFGLFCMPTPVGSLYSPSATADDPESPMLVSTCLFWGYACVC